MSPVTRVSRIGRSAAIVLLIVMVPANAQTNCTGWTAKTTRAPEALCGCEVVSTRFLEVLRARDDYPTLRDVASKRCPGLVAALDRHGSERTSTKSARSARKNSAMPAPTFVQRLTGAANGPGATGNRPVIGQTPVVARNIPTDTQDDDRGPANNGRKGVSSPGHSAGHENGIGGSDQTGGSASGGGGSSASSGSADRGGPSDRGGSRGGGSRSARK